MSEIIKFASRYTVIVIYDDKSHYPFTYAIICEENIFQLNLVRRFKNGLIYHLMNLFNKVYTIGDIVSTVAY